MGCLGGHNSYGGERRRDLSEEFESYLFWPMSQCHVLMSMSVLSTSVILVDILQFSRSMQFFAKKRFKLDLQTFPAERKTLAIQIWSSKIFLKSVRVILSRSLLFPPLRARPCRVVVFISPPVPPCGPAPVAPIVSGLSPPVSSSLTINWSCRMQIWS